MPTFHTDRQIVRRHELETLGLSAWRIQRLLDDGKLQRVGRGLYIWARARPSEHRTLAEASVRVSHGVVCLLSALAFHRLGTQLPHAVWMAIHVKARRPRVDWPPIHFVRFSGRAWTHGIDEHAIERVTVRVTSPAKTVADCFKYRNKIGLDVALEALREYLGRRGRRLDALLEAADVCRVRRIMMPYVEALA